MTVALPEGCSLTALERTGSTNDEAKQRASDGAADGTVVWAREQTAGRGRRGREWSSPRGNLYVSIVLRPARSARESAQLSLVAAVALAEAINDFLPDNSNLRCKWPNDLLIGGRKVAGILLESAGSASNDAAEWIVVGSGINIASHPDQAMYPATDLRSEGVYSVSVEAVLERYLARFFAWRDTWMENGIAPVRQSWLTRAAGLGEQITVRLPNRELRGRFAGMDEDGALLLEGPDGCHETISAGDIFL